ncbi:uncharacterized protein LOC121382148 [Gigantopelta aegis]|uniref:uncharacterized protein LOC121382148 n=1 Tax=Gigantopelta aegis TaxID=1735272 RepID=UPI001B88B6E5|nr:uncharacterized protein LOC121382148 [Gigantopelta aegis]
MLNEANNFTEVCLSAKVYITCVEHAACECNRTTDSTVGTALTYTHGLYASRDCQSAVGPLPVTQGVTCYDNATNTTVKGEIVALAVADSALVAGLERICSGFRDCYVTYDEKAAQALHHRDLSSLCSVLEETIQCFQTAACACGKTSHSEIVSDLAYNRNVYMSTCGIIRDINGLQRITCDTNQNGTWTNPSSCHDHNPLYGCFNKFQWDLTTAKTQADHRCKAYMYYMDCVEDLACRCGLIRDVTVYRSLANFASQYSKEQCDTLFQKLQPMPGIQCQDGGGTRGEEDRLVLALAEAPSVTSENKKCPGLHSCYSALDEQLGKALFQKNLPKMCLAQKSYVECLEHVFCTCGTFHTLNVTEFLHFQRQTHQRICAEDAPIRAMYTCNVSSSSAKFNRLPASFLLSVVWAFVFILKDRRL